MVANQWQRLRWTIPLLLIFTTIIDAALPAIFPVAFLNREQIVVSHITLYFIVLFSFYFKENYMLLYGFLMGLFYDSYNTTLLGLNATLYFVIVYVILKIKKYLPKNAAVQFMLFFLALMFQDTVTYFFYYEIDVTNLTMTGFIVTRLVPTLIFNIVVAVLAYFPAKGLMRWLGWEDYIVI